MSLFARARLDRINPAQGGPRGMRIVATMMLVVMAGVYLAARSQEDLHPAWGFVRAFAEAAMVGGLADWFAVTAIFRHPLGLPIPHTAIIPRNKDRIGDTLAVFLKDNFLIPTVVARRMRRLDVAGTMGRFLASPAGEGRLREGAAELLARILESLDQERLGGTVKAMVASRLRAIDVGPLLGQTIEAAIKEDRHLPVIDGIVAWAANILDANEDLIHDMVRERAGKILRWTGLDERVANAIIDGLRRMLVQMHFDPDHPLRAKANEGIERLAFALQHEPETLARAEEWKGQILANPAVGRWIDGLWESARGGLLRAARDPDRVMAGRFGEALRELGETLQRDAQLARAINMFARRAAVGAVASYGDSIVRLVSDTVRGWDVGTVTNRLENAVGRDLQYIRINGTLVGGLVGVVIHTVNALA